MHSRRQSVIPRRLVTVVVAGVSLAFGLILAEMPLSAGQGRSAGAPPTATPQQTGPSRGSGRGGGPPSALPSLVTNQWWQNEAVKADLALSPQLVTGLDRRYTEFREDFRRMSGELDKLAREMNALIAGRQVTPDEIALKAVAVEAIRARMFENRTVMYYESTRQLRPEQYAKLRAWWQARTGRGGSNRPAPPVLGTEWWKDETFKRELGMTEQLSAQLEQNYQRRLRNATPLIEELQKESEALDAMIAAREVRDEAVGAKVVQVEALRSRINETRTVMLYRFFQLLTPEQYTKFDALMKNRGRGRGGSQ